MFQLALQTARQCFGGDWAKCRRDVYEALPAKQERLRIDRDVDSLFNKWLKLPSMYSSKCPKWEPVDISAELGWGCPTEADCIEQLQSIIETLQVGDEVHACVWYAEGELARKKRALELIEKCARESGYQPTPSEIERDMYNPPLPGAIGSESSAISVTRGGTTPTPRGQASASPDSDQASGGPASGQASGDPARQSQSGGDISDRGPVRDTQTSHSTHISPRPVDTRAAEVQAAAIATVASLGPGGGNEASGVSWYTHLSLGIGFPKIPIFVDNESVSTGSQPSQSSAAESGLGLGLSLDVELWPVFSPYAGIAVYGNAMGGYLAAPDMSAVGFVATAGLRAQLGLDGRLSVLGDVGQSFRFGSTSVTTDTYFGQFESHSSTVGSATAVLRRIGGGLRLCLSRQTGDPRFCATTLDVMVFRDLGTQQPSTWRLQYGTRKEFSLWLELSPEYPAAGEPANPTDSKTAILFMAHMGLAYDRFGGKW